MKVSIIMPVYNETDTELSKSIQSILSQTFTNLELIIIDDNPRSNRIKTLLEQIKYTDSRIKILYNSQNLGPSISSNKGVKVAHGEFIAKMDADDISKKYRLKSQLNFIIHNKLDLVCSNFVGFNNSKIDELPYFGTNTLINQNNIKKILLHVNIAIGPTLLFRRKPFLNMGGYRNIVSEDYDLITRFVIHNCRVGYQSSVLILKRNRGNNLSNSNGLEEFLISSLIRKYIKVNKYTNVLPMRVINNSVNNLITTHDKNEFNKFNIYFSKFKAFKSLHYFIELINLSLSSKIVFKRNLQMLFNKFNRKKV